MKGNDLNGNRVVRSDDSANQAAGTEQPQTYQAAREQKKEHEKQSAQEGVQKAGKTAGAAVGAYFGGSAGAKVGAKVGDAIGKSKIGQQLGKNIAKNPLARKALSKANDSGALDVANKATDIATQDPKNMGGSELSIPNRAGNTLPSGTQSVSDGEESVGRRRPSKPNFLDDDNQREESFGHYV